MNWADYRKELMHAIDSFEFDPEILRILGDSKKNGQTIYVAGNGGSASIAHHYVCDLLKGANQDWRENRNRYRAICLSSNIGYMTAVANDESYEEIFRQQLINLARPNDILVLISSSGNSPNIVKAAECGKELGLIVIGLTGFNGGKLKQIAHYSGHVSHNKYEICENIHDIFGQFLAQYLREDSRQ